MSRRRTSGWELLARFVFGRDLVGAGTDATFWSGGTDGAGSWFFSEPTSWRLMAGWKRSLVRLALVLAPGGWLLYPTETMWAIGLPVAAGAGVAAARGWWLYQDWHLIRTYRDPLHVALTTALNLSGVNPEDYIFIPWEWAIDKVSEPVKVILPADFDANAENQARIGGLMMQKLDVSALTHTYSADTVGTPVMTVSFEPVPPGMIPVSELIEEIDACGPSEIVLGRTASSIYKCDFAQESPHAGFSCESGTGKSSLLQFIAAQIVRKNPDNRVTGLDPKRASLTPVAGLPNVEIYTDAIAAAIEKMWKAVADLKDVVIDRGIQLENDPTVTFPKWFLLIDEINFLAVLTKSHWVKVRGKDDPKQAPFWDDLLILLAAGRQFGVHVVIVGQDMRETALGGIGLRTMLGLRGIAGYDSAMWIRFMQTRPIPRVPKEPGRWYFSQKGERALVQLAYGRPQEIVDLGRGGRPMSQVGPEPQVNAGDGQTLDSDLGQPEDVVVGLENGALAAGLSYAAFVKRRARATKAGRPIPGEEKLGNQPTWPLRSLKEWVSEDARVG